VKLPISCRCDTWRPEPHGEATASRCTLLLAGILLKMGGLCLRRLQRASCCPQPTPVAPLLVVLGVVNIIYAALTPSPTRQPQTPRRLPARSSQPWLRADWHSAAFSALGPPAAPLLQMVRPWPDRQALFFSWWAHLRNRPTPCKLEGRWARVARRCARCSPSGPSVRWPRWPYRA